MPESRIDRTVKRAPLVSIIIPCWNGEKYLSEAISSAISQTYKEIEIIVVDDGSSDGSLDVARGFPGLTIISQPNSGVSAARNTGLEKANGEFVVFLDADDRLDPKAVRLHLEGFSQSNTIPMVYGSNKVIDANGNVIGHNLQIARTFSWKDVIMGVTPTPSQSMFRREALNKVGMFDPEVALGEDFDLYLRVTSLADGLCHGNVVADYRKHPLQATKQPSASLLSILRVVDKFERYLAERSQEDQILKQSRRHWCSYYGQYIPFEIAKSTAQRDWSRTAAAIHCYIRYLPHTFAGSIQYATSRTRQLFAR